jgi:hypothetical protein
MGVKFKTKNADQFHISLRFNTGKINAYHEYRYRPGAQPGLKSRIPKIDREW